MYLHEKCNHIEHIKRMAAKGILQNSPSHKFDSSDPIESITKMASTLLECQQIPGMSIAIIQGTNVVTIPLGTLDGTNAVNPSTNFGIGDIQILFQNGN